MADEKYHVLIDKLNSFKQLDHENAETMYLRLNILVNEINSLDVNKIEALWGTPPQFSLQKKLLKAIKFIYENMVFFICNVFCAP